MTGPESGALYQYIEFCRNAETLWHKLQSGHWDWLGVHPKGQFVLGRPRRGGLTDAATYVLRSGEARAEYERMIEQLDNPAQSPVLARVVLIQDGYPTDERFVAQTPAPTYQ